MTLKTRIDAFVQLGNWMGTMSESDFQSIAQATANENPWFTSDSLRLTFRSWANTLTRSALEQWTAGLTDQEVTERKIGLVLAGNIPLVGLHDIITTLVTGHQALIKASHKDSLLVKLVLEKLTEFEPAFTNKAVIVERLAGMDGIIATGSDNSARYFHFYFDKYPNIIRQNRTSVAVLNGTESNEELANLGKDVFSYFGLGCRNVSKLYVPQNYSFTPLFEAWESNQPIINHHKYANNYDYQKSIHLVNRIHFLDNGFCLLTESEKLVSPISVIYFEYYQPETLQSILASNSEKIQCIVGRSKTWIPFGQAQYPKLDDYADNKNTLEFLKSL